ncbi:MAG TPA: 50S ribosomal protein L24 [Candidatus Saccharimonadales bacterium]|nr:50S ribosomal protein L24 [Candidatus Saccharimonadales bacterium]
MSALRIKKGDTVMVRAGREKGKTGKVLSVSPTAGTVMVEGVNIVTKHIKRTQANPRGGIEKVARPLPISKVSIVHPDKEGRTSRVGYQLAKDGTKTRVYRQAANKEIK